MELQKFDLRQVNVKFRNDNLQIIFASLIVPYNYENREYNYDYSL